MEQPFEPTQEGNSRYNLRPQKNRSKKKKTETETTISASIQILTFYQEIKQCRICLDSQSSMANELLAPCDCIGSVRYVHSDCFKKWIMMRFQRQSPENKQSMIKDGMQCEICKIKVYPQFKQQILCNQKQAIYKKINIQLWFFYISLVVIAIQIPFICYIFGSFYKYLMNFKDNMIESLVILFITISFLITLIILIYKFTTTFLISQVSILQYFGKKKAISNDKRANKMRVNPINIQNLQ